MQHALLHIKNLRSMHDMLYFDQQRDYKVFIVKYRFYNAKEINVSGQNDKPNSSLRMKFFGVAAKAIKIAGAAALCTYFPELPYSLTLIAMAKLNMDHFPHFRLFNLPRDNVSKVASRFCLLACCNTCAVFAQLGFIPQSWRLPDGQPMLNYLSAGKSAFLTLACVTVACLVNRQHQKPN